MTLSVRVQTVVDAPPERVFAFMTDFPVFARVMHSAVETYFVGDSTMGLGAEWLQKTGDSAEEMTEARHRIVAFDPPHSFTMESVDHSSTETMIFRLSESGNGTRVEFHNQLRAHSIWLLIFALIGMGFIRKAMRADLERVRDTIEGKLPVPKI